MAIEITQLRQRQSLPLDAKVAMSSIRIRDWYNHHHGKVYVSFSGGKDSTVLLHIVRSIYPEVPGVFCDTGLEYPEIKEFVRATPNITTMRPLVSFPRVIEKHGYPLVSKKVARFVSDLQNKGTGNAATKNLRLTGLNRSGVYCPSQKIPRKWLPLVDAPFRVSDKCCDVMKKEPFHRYVKETARYPMSAVMACESNMREKMYLANGCNSFTGKANQISMPMAFWLEADVWEYIRTRDVGYSKIYDMGEKRTGCCFCMFGVHLEKGENRFQRMKKTHPQMYSYCMDKLGLRGCLEYIGVEA